MKEDLPTRPEPGWYYRLSAFFRKNFGEAVYKIPLDAGFTCPNRDGTIGTTGCSFCYNPAFAPFSGSGAALNISDQLKQGKKKKKHALYLAYFQSYTNTYAPLEELEKIYRGALADPDVIGLSIATRPDCISEEILDLLSLIAETKHVWIEYGLQSAHDSTLKRINRGHDVATFAGAVEKTRNRGIYICAHTILGLPGETPEMIFETVDFLNCLAIDGIKFHHLQVIRGTALASEYAKGAVEVFPATNDYIPLISDCLERTLPEIVIHRLAAQVTSRDLLLAPHWPESAGQIAAMVEAELKKRNAWQGCRCIR